MPPLRSRIRKHPVATFVIGAYAFTWAIWFPLLIAYEGGRITLTPTITAVFVLGSFGPLFSAAVVTSLIGGSLRA
ncbi:hypothetical protein HSRCO_1558 [Halanaeroarchaeum sp. HSR-CO]|nr:hypothetical protein HSRCO_1558 [Halanaeroarchaeum sp. HSR-CO]